MHSQEEVIETIKKENIELSRRVSQLLYEANEVTNKLNENLQWLKQLEK